VVKAPVKRRRGGGGISLFAIYKVVQERPFVPPVRIMKESGAHAVKLEGGSEVKDSVLRILSAGVPGWVIWA